MCRNLLYGGGKPSPWVQSRVATQVPKQALTLAPLCRAFTTPLSPRGSPPLKPAKNNFSIIKKRGRKKTYDLRITLAIKGAISLCFEYKSE